MKHPVSGGVAMEDSRVVPSTFAQRKAGTGRTIARAPSLWKPSGCRCDSPFSRHLGDRQRFSRLDCVPLTDNRRSRNGRLWPHPRTKSWQRLDSEPLCRQTSRRRYPPGSGRGGDAARPARGHSIRSHYGMSSQPSSQTRILSMPPAEFTSRFGGSSSSGQSRLHPRGRYAGGAHASCTPGRGGCWRSALPSDT